MNKGFKRLLKERYQIFKAFINKIFKNRLLIDYIKKMPMRAEKYISPQAGFFKARLALLVPAHGHAKTAEIYNALLFC